MKKFLLILLMVLCMALPAAAKTTEVTTSQDLLDAVASADSGDTIVIAGNISLPVIQYDDDNKCGLYISSDKTMTIQINKDCELQVSGTSTTAIRNYGNLTILGNGKITSTSNSARPARGVVGQEGSTTVIKGSVEIAATATKHNATGVFAEGGTVTIGDGVKIVAIGKEKQLGVLAETAGAAINILNGIVSGDLLIGEEGTMTVYAGKFSNKVEDKYLAPDSVCSDEQTGGFYVVTNELAVKLDPASLDVAPGKTGTVNVSLLTKDSNVCSLDVILVQPAVEGITVTPSSADGTITVKIAEACEKGSYDFAVACAGTYDGKQRYQTGTFTVTVKDRDVSSGGCNAGFGALALAAFALLAAKRKK